MKVIKRKIIADADLTSNVTITETAWTAGTYTLGQRRYLASTFDLYQVLVASTTDEPSLGAAKDIPTWGLVGKINKFAMFDGRLNNSTTRASLIDVSITSGGELINGVAVFGALGTTARVYVEYDSTIVYDQTKPLVNNDAIISWYDYFFAETVLNTDLLFLDIPSYLNTVVHLEITSSGTAQCGELVVGAVYDLGDTLENVEIVLDDYSRKEIDIFGSAIIVPRSYAFSVTYPVGFDSVDAPRLQKVLSSIRATPAVYIGERANVATAVYGFLNAFNMPLQVNRSEMKLEVKGLT